MNSMLEEYKSSLADLTFNSKPLINMLTVLAEENYSFAADIVRIIETQVYQSPPKQRLPVLYLIDSIVKSYTPYVKLFSPNLIKTFLFVFEKAETRVRQDLFKLRSTWNSMFPKMLLHDLDIAVKQFDPNWPIRKKKVVHSSGLTLDERVAAMISSQQSSSDNQDSRFSSDEEEYNASYLEEEGASPHGGTEILVEEEEILVDEDESEDLEALERALLKKKEELSHLESLDDEEQEEKPGTSGIHTEPQTSVISQVKPLKPSPQSISPRVQVPYFIDAKEEEDLFRSYATKEETDEPQVKRLKTEADDLLMVPGLRRISHELLEDEQLTVGCKPEPAQEKDESKPLKISEVKDAEAQTDPQEQKEVVHPRADTQDQSTQYRYRKKTKNFLSQYRVPSKSVATYFRIKTKEAQTQYTLPLDSQDAPADSTSGNLDGRSDFSFKERSALKEYVSALKDDFLPQGYSKHSGIVLRSLYAQRRQGLLCDITLGAEGRVFKAHKSVLAASSDFFHTLFASEEIEKTPLSHIELQGITAKALSLVLDYIYTSVLPIGSLSSVDEIIIAAKRLQILSLISTCPALEDAVAKKTDLSGWLISNSSLLSPSDKHPYVEAVNSLRTLGSSTGGRGNDLKSRRHDVVSASGDGGAGDFICHVDRDVAIRKRGSDSHGLPDSYLSNDEVKNKKKKHSKAKHEYEAKSDSDSDLDDDGLPKLDESPLKDAKYAGGVGASPGMPPASWMGNSPKTKKKNKKGIDAETFVWKCMNCKRFIHSKRNYTSHCEAHLRKGQKPYACKLCKKAFWKDSALESHMYKVHAELSSSEIEKLISPKVLMTEAQHSLQQNKKDSHTTSPTAPGRAKDSSKAKDGVRHKKECPSCKLVLQSEVLLARHMRLHHPDVGLPSNYQYQCGYCLQYFKTGAARAAHVKTHLRAGHLPHDQKKDAKPVEEEIDLGDSEDDSLEEASMMYSSNHEDEGANVAEEAAPDTPEGESALKLKLYQCEVCGEMFSIQCFYKAHMAGHKRNLEEF